MYAQNNTSAYPSMTEPYPIQNPRPDRNDILPTIVTEDELCNDVWESTSAHPRGPIGTDLENELGKNHPAIDTIILLTEKIAESLKNREYCINGNTYPLTVGHSPLLNTVSPDTKTLAEELSLIRRPAFYGTDKQITTREQIAKTSYWTLAPAAKHYIDMQSIRGLGPEYVHQTSDRSEDMAHAVGIELEKARLDAKPGIQTESFVRLPNHVHDDEYANKVYDVVAFNPTNNSVVETVEVELQTDDAGHIARDAAKLANAPGKSVWSLPNKACMNQLLRSMVREGILTPDGDDPGFPHALATPLANERIEQLLLAGKYRRLGNDLPVTKVRTFNGTRNRVQTVSPDALSMQAVEIGGEQR